jgi:phytoene synthase
MGIMNPETTSLSESQWRAIDARVRRVDEDRWLSSRYAPKTARSSLIALYALTYELARIRLVVTEQTLGAIRFQWWRDAIEEIEAGSPPRQHDVALAINEVIAGGVVKSASLQKLIDGYQAAFEAADRDQEPEAWLASIAANILAPAHGWGQYLRDVAPAFAATRRSDSKAFGPHVKTAPAAIRPAIAHFRLRKHYIAEKPPGLMLKRFSVMRGIMSGRV